MDFIRENWIVIVVVVFIVVFLIRFGRAIADHIRFARQIDQEGVVANATVSRVVIDRDTDGHTSRITYVTYRDDTDMQRESPLNASAADKYERDDRLRIKFLPGQYDMVIPVKEN